MDENQQVKVYSEDEFYETFKPQQLGEGESETVEFDEARKHDMHKVWSLVDVETGGVWAVPGFHVVNVYGYVICEEPWTNELDEAIWFEPIRGDE